ncbi:MAG: bifunctional DNA-formamidopyrimidine glycosylase/DNA-(apurinic or apyrimidinic site) lyase [Methylotenera sp.]|nr:bifunctional DNA-formamidopyrimidine glycosylase/DNA-(apurinic or apyrimidinic site) lyase [Methylotenera sp.]OQW69055.1 MAG: DNA-formamidopyrimidine glycosylase [Proteobacteria bacterium ST_bin12]
MPELPEVEITRRGLLPLINQGVTQVVIRNASMRWPIPSHLPETLQGKKLLNLTRRAKYILAEFGAVSGDKTVPLGTLLLHLGMSGRICLLERNYPPEKHDHFDIVFDNGKVLRLRDPRRFGAVLWAGDNPNEHMLISVLGPEPLEDRFSAQYLYDAIRTRTAAIKVTIMDSHLVVGVGNIYASESLFRARIHPESPAKNLTLKMCEKLVAEIKSTLNDALNAGGSSLRDFFGTDGNPGYFQQDYFVYGRTDEPCKICASAIKNIRLGQRSTFYCTNCQAK